MSDADESSGTGLPGASSAPAAPQPAADQAVASFEAASLREDQIQNAVAFLSHPKVRGSPVSAKRSFLEKKGLTNAEIDEAFKRVPEAPAAAAAPAPATAAMPATTATATYGANNLVTYTQQQPAHAVPASQALVPQPTQPGALVPLQQQQLMAPPQQPVRWTQVVLGLGVAAASLYGLHQLLAPRVTAWAHQLTASRRAAQEAEAARTAALTAALQSLSEGQQQLLDSMQGLAAALQQQQQQWPGSSQAVRVVGGSGAYGGPGEAQSSISFHQQRVIYDEQLRCQSPGAAAAGSGGSQRQQQQQYSSNVRGWDPYADPSQGAAIRSGGGTSGPGYSSASNYSAAQQQQQQQQQQQEGAASSIGGAGAGPAGGFEVVPRGMQAGSDAMWGASSGSSQRARAGTAGAPQPQQQQQQQQQGGRPDEAPHSAAFQEVMEMVRAGITPPNVRTDIDDSPPDPARPISAPQLAPRGKPWERSSVSSNTGSTPAAYGAASAAPSAVEDNFFQQQQQQPYYGGSNGFGAADGYSSYSTAGAASSYAAPAAAGPGSASSIVDSLEAAAASSRHKSMEKAGAAYDLSHLLGHDPGSSDAPWRPPPPPAATVVARPGSSGSSSSRTGAGPAVGGAGAAVPSAEQVVAGVAASAVANVVAASENEQGVEAALA